jgi:general secretion pathway protein G
MQVKRQRRRGGFTLIEVLLVLVILVIMASFAGFFVLGAQKRALQDATRTQIGTFKTAIESYMVDVRKYPSSNDGLNALIAAPTDLANPTRWRGPYLEGVEIPLDPWDSPYNYQLEGTQYVIWSNGEDGVSGTEDDIRSNALQN